MIITKNDLITNYPRRKKIIFVFFCKKSPKKSLYVEKEIHIQILNWIHRLKLSDFTNELLEINELDLA